MARVLLVDDDTALTEVLALSLHEAGHETCRASDGVRALEEQRAYAPDVIVADVNMPRLDGFSLCKRLREARIATPIILLTSRDNDIDETLGLELGADDYVTKPFSTRVLLARIAALLRRDAARARPDEPSRAVAIGELQLDVDRLEAQWKRQPLALTLTEFRLIAALTQRPEIVLSRARLMELVRGDDSVVSPRIVDVYVRRLRKKLAEVDPGFSCIDTVIGAGYRWIVR